MVIVFSSVIIILMNILKEIFKDQNVYETKNS